MFAQGRKRILPAFAAVLLMAAPGFAEAPAAHAAGPAAGKTTIRKMPGRIKSAVRCRICAGARCTVVAVRGRCTKGAALAALEQRLKQRQRRQSAVRRRSTDDRGYRDLPHGTSRRVPAHTPEWTNPGDSDPGMTILETARHDLDAIQVHPVPRRALPGPRRIDKSPKRPEEDDDDGKQRRDAASAHALHRRMDAQAQPARKGPAE